MNSAGVAASRISSWKSPLDQLDRYRPNAVVVEHSIEYRTVASSHAAGRRSPVVRAMIARRACASSRAAAKKAKTSSLIPAPDAGTGEMPTSAATRSGASATRRWATLPPIEWPTTEKLSQPRLSASTIASAAISSTVQAPSAVRESP